MILNHNKISCIKLVLIYMMHGHTYIILQEVSIFFKFILWVQFWCVFVFVCVCVCVCPLRLRVFVNRVLRLVLGPKRDEVTGELRKLHNEQLSDLYSLPNIVRVVKSRIMRWVGHAARMGQGRGVHRVLVGKPEGKRPLGRPRRRWEDNIKMDLQEV